MAFFHHHLVESNQYFDAGFEVVLVGPSNSGKSSIVHRFVHDKFSRWMTSTSGLDVGLKIVDCGGIKCKLSIFDTAGHDQFEELYHDYYARCHGLFLVFDLTDRLSFLSLSTWIRSFANHINQHTIVFLIGNKCEEDSDVSAEDIERFCGTEKIITEYFEVSASTGLNIDTIFQALLAHIFDHMIQNARARESIIMKRGKPIKPKFTSIDKTKFEQHWQTVTWVNNHEQSNCYICGKEFNWWKRVHHCRCCGNCVCQTCSPTKKLLPEFGYDRIKQRICNYCNGDKDAQIIVNSRLINPM